MSAYTNESQPPYTAARSMPTPVSSMMSRGRRGAERDLEQPQQILRERSDRGALEEQPLHEAQHVRERIDGGEELQPPRHVLDRCREPRQQREWQQHRERAEKGLLLGAHE